MKISMPQKDKHHNEAMDYFAELRDLSKIRDDLWQLKVTVPEITILDNLYMAFNDEEIDFLQQEIHRYRGTTQHVPSRADRDTYKLKVLRAGMYKMIEPILGQEGKANISQIVLISIIYPLLDIIERDLVEEETK